MSNYQNQGKFKAQGKRYNTNNTNDYEREHPYHGYGSKPHSQYGGGQDQRPHDGHAKNQ